MNASKIYYFCLSLSLIAYLVGCTDGELQTTEDGGTLRSDRSTAVEGPPLSDGGLPATDHANPRVDTGALDLGVAPDIWIPPECQQADAGSGGGVLSRGLRWVRDNPMFISGLNIGMGTPPQAAVDEYHDQFHANAVHLHTSGLPDEVNGWRAAGRGDFRFVSWVEADGTSLGSGQVLGGASPGQGGRIGYQIGDEPGMSSAPPWSTYKQGISSVRAADPDGLIIVNFNTIPDQSEVESYVNEFTSSLGGDVISCDIYARHDLWDEYPWIALFRRKGLESGKPYWAYLNAFSDSVDMEWWSESDMRFEAFLYLLHGYSGFTWFFYQVYDGSQVFPAFYSAANDFNAAKTSRWQVAAQINQELANLGRATTQLTSTDVRYITTTPLVDLWLYSITTPWSQNAGGDPLVTAIEPGPNANLAVGSFEDDFGEKYTMLLNLHHSGSDFYATSLVPVTTRISFDFSTISAACMDKSKLLVLNQGTGQVDEVTLSNPGDHPYLEVTLGPGEPFFFKYKTARPFAMR